MTEDERAQVCAIRDRVTRAMWPRMMVCNFTQEKVTSYPPHTVQVTAASADEAVVMQHALADLRFLLLQLECLQVAQAIIAAGTTVSESVGRSA